MTDENVGLDCEMDDENFENASRITARGVVSDRLNDSTYGVTLEDDRKITCHLSGRLRQKFIRLLIGDGVDVELSPYDMNHGRIVERYKQDN